MPSYVDAVRSFSPACFLPLGDTSGLTDLSGNGHDGTGQGGVTVGGVSGPLAVGDQGATLFDGSGDAVTTSYGTRRNLSIRPLTTATQVIPDGAVRATHAVVAGAGESGNDFFTETTIVTAGTGGGFQLGPDVAEGDELTASVRLLAVPAGKTVQFQIGWKDSSDANLGSGTFFTTTTTGRVSVTGIAPATAASCFVAIYILSAAVGEKVSYDGLLIETGGVAGDYFPTLAQLTSGEAGWSGTAHASVSDIGCFARGTQRTFQGWVYRGSDTAEDTIFGGQTASPTPGKALYLSVTSSGYLVFTPSGETGDDVSWANAFVGLTGEWHHIALVVDEPGNVATAYLDGVSLGDRTLTATYSNLGPLMIGARVTPSIGPWDGRMAWFSVHERALTAGEIASVHNIGTGEYFDPDTDSPNYQNNMTIEPYSNSLTILGGPNGS